jgi:hypothetical protein
MLMNKIRIAGLVTMAVSWHAARILTGRGVADSALAGDVWLLGLHFDLAAQAGE